MWPTKERIRRFLSNGLSLPKRPMVGIGEPFNHLTVIGHPFYAVLHQSKGSEQCVVCSCDCGGIVVATCNALKQKRIGTCGPSHGNTKHGKSHSPEYKAWRAMKRRCHEHGGRGRYREKGIKVCGRWLNSFENFLADMGPKPSPRHTIERKKNAEDYEPGNCVWALPKEQARNRDTNVFVTLNGRRMTVSEAAELHGIDRSTLDGRLRRGMSIEKAVSVPVETKFRSRT